ncbi:MAG: hypothetical protein HY815_01285 [Candidatus Riflebacteria bacterium]|nr:hypothetical protein [Candidatus Riflebacteria bacterium]
MTSEARPHRRCPYWLLALATLAFVALWVSVGSVRLDGEALDSFVWLRTLIVRHDLDVDDTLFVLDRSGEERSARFRSFPGPALFGAPAYMLAHILSWTGRPWPPDGLSPAYWAWLSASSALVVLLGLVLLVRLLAYRGFDPVLALLLVGSYFLASPLLEVTLFRPGHPGAYAASLATALVALAAVGPRHWLGALALSAALISIGPSEWAWLLLALPLVARRPGRVGGLRAVYRAGLTTGLIGLALAPTVAVWWHTGTGPWGQPLLPGPFVPTGRQLLDRLGDVMLTHPIALVDRWLLPGLGVLCWIGLTMAGDGVTDRSAGLVSLTPLLCLGYAKLLDRLRRGRFPLVAVGLAAALVAGNLAALTASRALAPAQAHLKPLDLLVPLAGSPPGLVASALAPGDTYLPVATVLARAGWALPALVCLVVGALALTRLVLMKPDTAALLCLLLGIEVFGVMLVLQASRSGTVVGQVSWSGPGATLEARSPTAVWHVPPATVASRVDLITHLEDARGLATGSDVARIVVRDVHGRDLEYVVFAGLDTVDLTLPLGNGPAVALPAATGREARQGVLQAPTAGYVLTGCSTPVLSLRYLFRKSCALPGPTEVQEVRISRVAGQGRLRVLRVRLSLERRLRHDP